MAFNSNVPIPVTRGGSPLVGSPFACRVYYATSGQGRRSEIAPPISRVARPMALSLTDLKVPLQIGDMAQMPDGSYRKLIDIRAYRTRIQCELQWIPYQSLTRWSKPTLDAAVDHGTLNVTDATHSTSSTILAYIEPIDADHNVSGMGNADLREAKAYTTTSIQANDAVVDAQGAVWIALTASLYYPVSNDYVATMRYEAMGLSGL